MFKWISWALRVVATALLLSFLCIWTTGYIVNSYMESVLKQLDLPLEVQPLALSGVWGKLWGAERPPVKEAANRPAETPGESGPPSQSVSDDESGRSGNGADEVEATDEAVPPPEPAGATLEETVENPPEDALPVFGDESSIQSLTDEQRQSLYALVVSKLTPEELGKLSNYLQDGLTDEELTGLQEMLQSALTDEEYTQMMSLLQGELSPEE